MRSLYIMLIVLICFKGYSQGQNDTPLKLNNINAEAFGSGIGYSINYDRIITIDSLINLSLSVGYEYNDEHFLLSQFNILIGHTHYFEVGYGYLYCLNNSKLDYSRISSLRIGYRFQNIKRRGIVFRIGLTPLLNYNLDFNPIGVMMGISLGFNF